MRTLFALVAFVTALGSLAACDRTSGTPDAAPGAGPGAAPPQAAPPPAPAAEEASGHAPAGAVPGSYEDWCGGHAVPESQCTRCDPSLIPAFKAVNDWCAEHGLPESQCLACNPDLKIVRPAKTEGA